MGLKLLKVSLALLIAAGVIFLLKYYARERSPGLDECRRHLQLLEEAYGRRQASVRGYYEERILGAPNEVLSMKYQQEQNQELDKAKELYFRDKVAIGRGEYGVLASHWGKEVRQSPELLREDEKNTR